MLLFGSRAIRQHFPEFRPPQDWDLVGTKADIARLDGLLARPADQSQSLYKVHYEYDGRIVEVIDGEEVPYWGQMAELFAREPTLRDPVLGTMNVAPPGFLLLTKQCGLIYRIVHWHKNLEDLYFLRDRIPVLEPEIAALVEATQAEARRVYLDRHALARNDVLPCHPAVHARPSERHLALHELLAPSGVSGRTEEEPWAGFPGLSGDAKRQRMIDWFAEEAMVLAAEEHIEPRWGSAHAELPELLRYALRQMMTGRLPENWRYFGVNYYREIAARVPKDWPSRIGSWPVVRRVHEHPCSSDTQCNGRVTAGVGPLDS